MSYLTSNTVYWYIFFKKPAGYMVDMMMWGGGRGDPSTYFGLAFSAFCNSFRIGSPYKAS